MKASPHVCRCTCTYTCSTCICTYGYSESNYVRHFSHPHVICHVTRATEESSGQCGVTLPSAARGLSGHGCPVLVWLWEPQPCLQSPSETGVSSRPPLPLPSAPCMRRPLLPPLPPHCLIVLQLSALIIVYKYCVFMGNCRALIFGDWVPCLVSSGRCGT